MSLVCEYVELMFFVPTWHCMCVVLLMPQATPFNLEIEGCGLRDYGWGW